MKNITKNDLIALLKSIEGNPIIVISSDSEGNRFGTMCGYGIGSYEEKSYGGEIYEEGDAETPKNAVAAIVLYPKH
jgi:hypothetical protein